MDDKVKNHREQNEMNNTNSQKPEKKYMKLSTRLSISFSLLVGFFVLIIATTLFINTRNQERFNLKQRLANFATLTALQVNGDIHSTINGEQEMQSEAYLNYQKLFFDMIRADEELIYVYSMRQEQDGVIYFYLDAGRDPSIEEYDVAIPGDLPYEEPSDLLLATFASPSSTVVENDIYTDEYGSFLSAYSPVYKSDGALEAIIGIDINATALIARERLLLTTTTIIILVTIPFIFTMGWLLGRSLAKPISNLVETVNLITSGDLRARVKNTSRSQEVYTLEKNFNMMAGQLQDLFEHQEERIAERTAMLEESSAQNLARATQLETIAEVASTIAITNDLEQLLPLITQTVSERFGFYHVGIFLLSKDGLYAVLKAANSEGGQAMLARNHQLRVGREGVVGFAMYQKRAHIALDVGEDAVYFNNPDLPETHSEIALPLMTGDNIMGVLDVQSTEQNAFSDDDISLLTILANQVSIAIDNANLFQQSRKALEELDETLHKYIRAEWRQLSSKQNVVGYRANTAGVETITTIQHSQKKKVSAHSIPLTLRGTEIGALNIDMGKGKVFSDDETVLIQSVADRLTIALESARLLEESQKTAAKEQLIGDITSKISSSINLKNLLQTAVEELGQVIPGSEVVIKLDKKENE